MYNTELGDSTHALYRRMRCCVTAYTIPLYMYLCYVHPPNYDHPNVLSEKVLKRRWLSEISLAVSSHSTNVFSARTMGGTKQKNMIDIMKAVQTTYVLYHDKKARSHIPAVRVLLGGDQLTVERSRGAQKAFRDDNTHFETIEGLLQKVEDFHRQMAFLDTMFSKLYSTASVNDPETLFHLRTMLNRRNVVKDARKGYQACSTFTTDVVTGHVVACAMKLWHYVHGPKVCSTKGSESNT